MDPDNTKIMRFWKILKQQEDLKVTARTAFQNDLFEGAAEIYGQCLALDPMNGVFN